MVSIKDSCTREIRLSLEKRDEILSSAFNGCPILMARSPSSNIRILLLERDKLKTLNKDPKTNSEIVPGTILCIYLNFLS